ncbi:MAG: SURF1 family protein [Acidovorax sp.]|uniref:SURF1 family protein n=1 Tax=Acidovorax sp. TaxID=1872122 RepID=UPI0039E4963F
MTARARLPQAVLALAGIALFLGFVALGTWQVERRAWKLALIERVERRVHATPMAPPPASQWQQVSTTGHEYLPVALQGRWLDGKTVLAQAVTELGAGFWVVTALEQADGTQVLVNRGFVPQAQRAQWLAAAPPPGPAAVQGLLRMNEPGGGFLRANDPAQQRWYSRDVAAMAQALQLPRAAPFFVDAGLPGTAPDAGWPRPGLTVVHFRNTHLVYALTWYSLALMVAAAFWYAARHERRQRPTP